MTQANKFLYIGFGLDPNKNGDDVSPLTLIDLGGPEKDERPVIIFDMDGTLSDDSKRKHYVTGEVKDYDSYFAEGRHDPINPKVVNRLIELWNEGFRISIITGRPDRYAMDTVRWLHEKGILQFVSDITMRHSHSYINHVDYKLAAVGLLASAGWTITQMYDDSRTVKAKFSELNMPFEVIDLNKVELILPNG